jgi:hypothetical protein
LQQMIRLKIYDYKTLSIQTHTIITSKAVTVTLNCLTKKFSSTRHLALIIVPSDNNECEMVVYGKIVYTILIRLSRCNNHVYNHIIINTCEDTYN